MQDTGSLGLVHWDDPEGWYGERGGRGGSGWGTRVHPWQLHVDVWQNQYNIVNLKNNNKIKESVLQCRGHRFSPWSGKIPHAVKQLSLCHNQRMSAPQERSHVMQQRSCVPQLRPDKAK